MSQPSPLFEALEPATLLDIAKKLAQESDSAALRTAGDRAYFAAFLTSRDQLAAKGYISPYDASEDHAYISRQLKLALGGIGDLELQLRRARNMVTYDTRDLTHDTRYARPLKWMIDTAESIIERVIALPKRA